MRNFQLDVVIFFQFICYLYLWIVKNYKCKIIFDVYDIIVDVLSQKFGLLIGWKRELIERL